MSAATQIVGLTQRARVLLNPHYAAGLNCLRDRVKICISDIKQPKQKSPDVSFLSLDI